MQAYQGAQTGHSQLTAALATIEFSEEYLSRRFAQLERKQKPVSFEISNDAGYTHQFHLLRENTYAGYKDSYDKHSDVLIARRGNHCVGGCRLTFREPGKTSLPLEADGLQLASLYPELPLDSVRSVEVSHMAWLSDSQDEEIIRGIFKEIFRTATAKHARFVFALAPLPMVGAYRKAAGQLGLKWSILSNTPVTEKDEYEGVKMALCMLDLGPTAKEKSNEKELVSEA